MKVSNNILYNINESDIDIVKPKFKGILKTGLELLIKDEKEAIKGYNSFLANISEETDEQTYNKIKEVIQHISMEEQEHIKELDKLYSSIRK